MLHSMSKSIVIALLSISISVSATPLEAGDSIRALDKKDAPVHVAYAVRVASRPEGHSIPEEALANVPAETVQWNTKRVSITDKQALDIWKKISKHVLQGDTGPSADPGSGRHLTSSWLLTHKNAIPDVRSDTTGILGFYYTPIGGTQRTKTVWNDISTDIYKTKVAYDANDVLSMCIIVIKLANGTNPGAWVVQKLNGPLICVHYKPGKNGSCFPTMDDVSKKKRNDHC